jgi:hypothetical protein
MGERESMEGIEFRNKSTNNRSDKLIVTSISIREGISLLRKRGKTKILYE